MNKNFKFFSAALAVMALASCSNDDLLSDIGGGVQKPAIGNGDLAVTFDPFEGMDTRAYRGNADGKPGTLFYVEGDQISVYDDELTRNDIYECQDRDGQLAFYWQPVTAGAKKRVEDEDAKYALSPATQLQRAYYDIYDEKLKAEFAVPRIITYDEKAEIVMNNGEIGYACDLPAFGEVSKTDNDYLSANMRHLVGILGIKLDNVFTNATWLKLSVPKGSGKYLSGTFVATLDVSTEAARKACRLEKGLDDLYVYEDIYVNLTKVPSPNSVIYIPIIPGIKADRDQLRLEYTTVTNLTETSVLTYNQWVNVGTLLEGEAEFTPHSYKERSHSYEYKTMSPNLISQLLYQYRNSVSDITIDVTEGFNMDQTNQAVTTTNLTRYGNTIYLPEFAKKDMKVTINFTGTKPFVVSNQNTSNTTNREALTFANANGESFTGAVEFNVNNRLADHKNQEYDILSDIVVNLPEADFTLAGNFVSESGVKVPRESTLTLKAAKSVSLGNGSTSTKIGAENQGLKLQPIPATVGSLTVKKNAVLTGDIETAKNVLTDVTVTGKVVGNITMTENRGLLTINSADATAAYDVIVDGKVETYGNVVVALGEEGVAVSDVLEMQGLGKNLKLVQGYIAEINCNVKTVGEWDEPYIEIYMDDENEGTVAFSVLRETVGKVYVSESVWNGKPVANDGGTMPNYSKYGRTTYYVGSNVVSQGAIFTANQLACAKWQDKDIVGELYTHMDLNNIKWVRKLNGVQGTVLDGSYKKNQIADRTRKTDDTVYKIKNLKLNNSAEGISNNKAGGFFDFVNNTLTVKNVKFETVKYEDNSKASNVGAIVGEIGSNIAYYGNKAVTIENVEITGINLNLGDKTAVGGVIGKVAHGSGNQVTLKNVKATGSINAYHSIGGLVGQIAFSTPVTFDKCTSDVEIKQSYNSGSEYDINYAKIGGFVGEASTAGKLIIKNGCTTSPVTANHADNEKVLDTNAGDGNAKYFHRSQNWIGFSGVGSNGPATYATTISNVAIHNNNDTDDNYGVPAFGAQAITGKSVLYYFSATK